MASPNLKVEIAFTSEPLDTTPTWVDVSQYVRATSDGMGGVYIERGKGPEIEPFEAGSCKVTLSNRDRRFDPSYAAGPHFGNLIPRKQLRVTATWATVDYPMFYGWVTGWPQGFAAQGKDATVTIEAIDAIAWLANTNLPDDLVYDYADTTIGSLALFLRQADVTRWSDATSNGYFATPFIGTPRMIGRRQFTTQFDPGTGQSGASLMPGSSSTAVVFDGATAWRTNATYVSAGNWTLSFWVQTRGSTANSVCLMSGNPPPASYMEVYLTTGGLINLLYDAFAGTTFTTAPLNNDIPHHVCITGHSVNGVFVWVDGVVSATTMAFQNLYLDRLGSTAAGTPGFFLTGTLQDVAVFNKALSALEIEGLYNLSRGFWQESSADRVTRLLDDVGWPAAWRDIAGNPRASVSELVYNGSSVLPKLQEVERSEQGMIFATKENFVAFRERYYANEVTVGNTVQQIFSDDNGATAAAYSTFQFQYNDIDVTNAVTVTTPTTLAKSSDATSITVNGLQSKKVDTILDTFAQADAMATGLVVQGKDATWRAAPITVYPENNETRWDEILGLELGYRVSMEITPMAVGSQNVQEVTLEQIEWSIVDTLWTLTVAGSPCFGGASGAEPGWFIIGQSLIDGPDVIGY